MSSSTNPTPSATAPASASASTSKANAAPALPVVKKTVRLSREEEEKKKKEEALARKKSLDDRFKNRRNKRTSVPSEDSPAGKKLKEEKNMSAYEREVAEINKRAGLSDGGAGVRSLVK